MSDRIFAVVWFGICVLIVVQMVSLTVPFAYEPVGPRAFPLLLACLMASCCVALALKPDPGIQWPAKGVLGRGCFLVLVLLAYAQVFETLGFPLATSLMAWMVSLLFGARWWSALLTAVSIGIGGYWVFDRLLEVSLPAGRWLA